MADKVLHIGYKEHRVFNIDIGTPKNYWEYESALGNFDGCKPGLPPGMTFRTDNVIGLITIEGAPTEAGWFQAGIEDRTPQHEGPFKFIQIQVVNITVKAVPSFPQKLAGGKQISPIKFVASGGTPPYRYHLMPGDSDTIFHHLPWGLILNENTGDVTGAPLVPRLSKPLVYDFRIGATDNNGIGGVYSTGITKFHTEVLRPAITVTGNPHSSFLGQTYTDTLSASGGTSPYTYVLGKSAKDLGVSVDSNTGKLTWTTPTLGLHTFWVGAHDVNGDGAHDGDGNSQKNGWLQYEVTITSPYTIHISPGSLPGALLRAPYTQYLYASGGNDPYYFRATSAPAGLTVSDHGMITWTPQTVGAFELSVQVTDKNGVTQDQTYHIDVQTRNIQVSSSNLPRAVSGHVVHGSFYASGGNSPYKYSYQRLSGPGGVDIDDHGHLTGSPDSDGTIRFKVTVTDNSPSHFTGEQEFSLVVEPVVSISSSPSTLEGYVGEAFTATFTAEGGSGHYTYEIFGTPPDGLSVNAQTGILSGIPTQAGVHSFTLGVEEYSARLGNGTNGRATFSINVRPALSITFKGPLTAKVGQAYTGFIHAEGGTGNYKYSVTGLKNGLTARDKQISGTPTATGPINFSVTVDDGHKPKTQQFQIDVTASSQTDLALGKLLRGHFALASGSGGETLTITGEVSGGGLSESNKPDKVVLQIKQPGQSTFVDAKTIGKLDWATNWKADGWEFTLSGIKWSAQNNVPRFEIQAKLDSHTSKSAIVLFPLSEFVKNLAFQDSDGEPLSGTLLSVKPGPQTLHLHMAFYNAIDQLTATLALPDGITGKALSPAVRAALPTALKVRSDWNGHTQPVLFEISKENPLKIASGTHQTVNLSIPVEVATTFRSGEAKCELTSSGESVENISNDTRPEKATLSLTASTS